MNKNFSILIPVYNFDVTKLVSALYSQATSLNIDFEILLIDDFSDINFIKKNNSLNELEHISITHLKKNVGRSKIRNILFDQAKYENCLILDCDMLIIKDNFLHNYLCELNNNIVVGGHCYSKNKPQNKAKFFHWKYGSTIEVKSLEKRKKNPYHSFMTSCFATTKSIFKNIKFNEKLAQYGHEDTLFGIELKKQLIQITHIDNPLQHIGIENYKIFMTKQEKAIQNLAFLYTQDSLKDDLSDLKLIEFYNSVYNKFPFTIFYNPLYSLARLLFKKQTNSSIIIFNFWKLITFNKAMNK